MIQKQNVNLNFSQGLDLKTDKWQVGFGKFLALNNSVFDIGGQLTKRNGFGKLTTLPDNTNTFITTFNGDLTAIGSSISTYSAQNEAWVNKGTLQPCRLSVLPLIRNNTNQSWADCAVDGRLVCTGYVDQDETNLTTNVSKFVLADSITGQNLIPPTLITNADATFGAPRVFSLGTSFLVIYARLVGGVVYALDYITINKITLVVGSPVTFVTNYSPTFGLAFDGVIFNNVLYFAWNTTTTSVDIIAINAVLLQTSVHTFSGEVATTISLCADQSTGTIWTTYYDSVSNIGDTFAVNTSLFTVLAPTQWTSVTVIDNVATVSSGGILTVYYEVDNNYAYDTAIPTHYINTNTVTQAGVVGTPSTLIRSVGLASKAFSINGEYYFLSAYQSPYQQTYFLINGEGGVVAKLAYENGGGYLPLGVPNATVIGSVVYIPYLYKDLIEAVNKNQQVPGALINGIYSQTGINMTAIDISTDFINTSEIGNDLHIAGGFLWIYDGYSPVEHLFHLFPDSVEATWSATGGFMDAQPPPSTTNTNAYYYQVTYEWTDNQGNAFRSAPSIAIPVTTTGTLSTGSVELKIPTLRLTYKINNPVKIVVYRWSVGQQSFYQTTTILQPVLNDTTVDFVTFVDINNDSTIIGNNLIYTTGGVLENIAMPALTNIFLFDDRLFGIDSEDRNLLLFSRQVIENTPVETSDALTIYVAPTISSNGSTGELTCGFPMDDKAILFKEDAINYINGTGPDNTGANNQYSQPIFITSTVGCNNPNSIVLMPTGLMFQSSKGIWLLGRDLSTTYIGAPVEQYNSNVVTSAVNIPSENQVRFTLDNGIILMYDYYYQQWGTFSPIKAISSTIYGLLQTYIDSSGRVYQETPGLYLDAGNPVQMSFTTSWLNMAGVQGYQRSYFFYLLGQFITPHKLNLSIAYDYNPSPQQSNLINPTNYSNNYGIDSPYGQGSPYGGPGNVEQWRVFLTKQRCQSFQITFEEIYDPTLGVAAGGGLTLSGLNLVFGIKKGWRPISASHTVGGN